jgi:DNA invertase Pin-like site-specific DNA recombinase
MLVGYARVSTKDQNLDMQLDALKAAGCERIFDDTISGARGDRPGLAKALEQLRPGDTLVIWKLDRLGRTLKQLINLVDELAARPVDFKSLTDNIDTSSPNGRFFFHMMASLAQMERELLKERTKAGIMAARKRGKHPGRRRRLDESKVQSAKRLLANGQPARQVATHLGVSISTLYRWIPAAESLSESSDS